MLSFSGDFVIFNSNMNLERAANWFRVGLRSFWSADIEDIYEFGNVKFGIKLEPFSQKRLTNATPNYFR